MKYYKEMELCRSSKLGRTYWLLEKYAKIYGKLLRAVQLICNINVILLMPVMIKICIIIFLVCFNHDHNGFALPAIER